jgi:hypothetical protein
VISKYDEEASRGLLVASSGFVVAVVTLQYTSFRVIARTARFVARVRTR